MGQMHQQVRIVFHHYAAAVALAFREVALGALGCVCGEHGAVFGEDLLAFPSLLGGLLGSGDLGRRALFKNLLHLVGHTLG